MDEEEGDGSAAKVGMSTPGGRVTGKELGEDALNT